MPQMTPVTFHRPASPIARDNLQGKTPLFAGPVSEDTASLTSAEPLALPEHSLIRQHVFGGKEPVPFLAWAKKDTLFRLTRYPKDVIESFYTNPGHIEHPFIGLYNLLWGWTYLLRPKGYMKTFHNENYVLDNRLDALGRRQAYLQADVYPHFYLKQGKLEEALRSFAKAIEADPEPGDSYYKLATFTHELLDYLQYMTEQEPGKSDQLPHPFEHALDHHRFDAFPWLKHRSKSKDWPSVGAGQTRVPLPTEVLKQKTVDWDALRNGLKNTELPLLAIAQEAYEKAGQHLQFEKMSDSGERFQKAHSFIMAKQLSGKPDDALQVAESYINGSLFKDWTTPRWDTTAPLLASLYQQAGQYDNAVDVFSKFLTTKGTDGIRMWGGDRKTKMVLEYLSVCDAKAKTDPSGKTSKWAVALPAFEQMAQEGLEAMERPPARKEISIYDLETFIYLGDAYAGLGRKSDADKAYNRALGVVEEQLEMSREYNSKASIVHYESDRDTLLKKKAVLN